MTPLLDEDLLHKKPSNTFKIGHVLAWVTLAIIGMVFKVMHWPGNALFLLLGFAGLLAYSVSGILRLKGKNLLNNITLGLAVLWTVYVLYSFLFAYRSFWNLNGLVSYVVLAVAIFLVYEIAHRSRKNR